MGRAFSATNSTRKQNESEMFKDRKISDLKEPSNVFKAFLDETSLHGWKFLNKDGNITLKLLWMLVLALACSASMLGMYYYGWQFGTATTMTTIDTSIAPLTVCEATFRPYCDRQLQLAKSFQFFAIHS